MLLPEGLQICGANGVTAIHSKTRHLPLVMGFVVCFNLLNRKCSFIVMFSKLLAKIKASRNVQAFAKIHKKSFKRDMVAFTSPQLPNRYFKNLNQLIKNTLLGEREKWVVFLRFGRFILCGLEPHDNRARL